MSKKLERLVRLVRQLYVGVAMVAAGGAATAQVLNSDYLMVLTPDPTISLSGPAWQCATTGACTLTGTPTASLYVTPTTAAGDTFNYNRAWGVWVLGKPGDLIDPNGFDHGSYIADIGKWSFTASGSIGSVPATPLFMTAYGTNTVSVSDGTHAYGGQSQLIGGGVSQLSTSYGPGSSAAFAAYGWFTFSQNLITPYYAYPSTTDPRCNSLSCLDYAAPIYTPNAYVLTFDLVSMSAVPEPGSAWLVLAGLGALAFSVRRRV